MLKPLLTSLLFTAFLFFFNFSVKAEIIRKSDNCEWDNINGIPCLYINKPIPNTSKLSETGINKYIITSREINESGALDINDVIEMVPGINITQSGPKGQQTSVFTRGTNSNHTLVLLNGIAINDQSTTQGLHDFGVDFIQSIHQVEVYTGPNGAHFGPGAIGGAINFITAVDFNNKIEIRAMDEKNNTFASNYTTTTKNNWVLNLKGGLTNSEMESARYGGTEKDTVKNFNANFNAEKWINDNVKLRATTYGRQTIAEYDDSLTSEYGYKGNNLMFASQFGFDRYKNNLSDHLTFHYHKYDREYEEQGILDEYLSNNFTTRAERKLQFSKKLSFGFGGEYKYDWGEFENRGSYAASTKGNVYNTGMFANVGLKPLDNTILSFYARSDSHKTTGINGTYKANITQNIDNLKIGFTHSTSLRNPSLYELYGTDNYGYSGNKNLNPEKIRNSEIFGVYNFFKNFMISLTGFKSNIYNQVEYKNNQYVNDISNIDLDQSGIETEFAWKNKNQKLSFFGTSLSSKKANGDDTLRRPEKIYGARYEKKIVTDFFGPLKFNLKYQHYGKHWDTHATNFSTLFMDSTDITDISLTKKKHGYEWLFSVSNLFDEAYQRPHGFSQESRQITFGLNKVF